MAKIGSLSAISLAVAAILALSSGGEHLHMILPGTLLAGTIFTMLGIIVATKISSLNQFLLWTVPLEAACFVPAILHLFKITPAWLRYHPINACMDLISGHAPSMTGILTIIIFQALLFVLSKKCVTNMWEEKDFLSCLPTNCP